MPKQVTVTLGGREYAVQEKPMGAAVEWRKKLRASRVMQVFTTLDQAIIDAFKMLDDWQNKGEVEPQDATSIARILPVIANGLLNSVDEVWDLVFEYAPDIEKDRAHIEKEAYDEEGIQAFIQVIKLNFPTTALWGILRPNSSRAQSTSTNSALRNGASGLPPGGPQKSSPKTSPTSLPTPGSEGNAGNIESKLEQT